MQPFRTAVARAHANHALHQSATDPAQHYRPDVVVCTSDYKFGFILDVCFGTDDKLLLEQDLIDLWPTYRSRKNQSGPSSTLFWTSSLFTDGNRPHASPALCTQLATTLPRLDRVHIFKHALYTRRYLPYVAAMKTVAPDITIRILPIAIGVLGVIPPFTRQYLSTVLGTKAVQTLMKKLTWVAQRSAIRGFKAMQQEAR
jgi:hypothetical protein